MPVSNALRRLLRVRDVEEEQCRLALESALGDLHQLQCARASAIARERSGRQLLLASVQLSETTDRSAALVEVHAGARCASALVARLAAAEGIVMRERTAYLEKRLERRQAQTIVDEAAAKDAIESGRRGQQALDEAFGTRRHREELNPIRSHSALKTSTGAGASGRGYPSELEPKSD